MGPEIISKVLSRSEVLETCQPVVYGNPGILGRALRLIGAGAAVHGSQVTFPEGGVEIVDPLPGEPIEVEAGILSRESSRLMMASIRQAALDCLSGKVHGMVTCPIQKRGIALAGYDYPGHTEFLQDLTGAGRVVMMLAGERLKVALVTIHVSLTEAIKRLTEEVIFETISIVHKDLTRRFGIAAPRIAVAGVNPHAGEGGLFGSEEKAVVEPAVSRARKEGVDAKGPYPPDTIFYRAYQGEFDVVVSMYHDQGLIPLKLVHFDTGVNVTLGLPIVRTSVDHGTAYDIAWEGKANDESLLWAIRFANMMVSGRGRNDR